MNSTHYSVVRGFITDNIFNSITRKMAAQQMNMSKKQLNRLLMKTHNLTVAKMIQQGKMKRLYALLTTNLSHSQIAEQVGFSNEYNLGRFFKHNEEMCPGRFRKPPEK